MDAKPILNIRSLKEQVYEYLRERMRTGELLPGAVIDMEETSRTLGVSKTPLRDALLQLEMEDFVTILPRRKIVVNTLTIQDVRNYYEIIGALESTALLAAFDRLREADLRRMEKANEGMKKAIDADDFDLYYERNLEFHDTFLDLCGNDEPGQDRQPPEEAPLRLPPAQGLRQGMGGGLDRRASPPPGASPAREEGRGRGLGQGRPLVVQGPGKIRQRILRRYLLTRAGRGRAEDSHE